MVSLRQTLFVVLVVVVILAAVGLWSFRQPAAELVRFSIDRSVIKDGENATITVTFKNIQMKEYIVEYQFNASDRLWIYEGAERLLPRIGAQYVFNYTLDASIPSETRVFVVVGTLEEGISSATYPISLAIYLDGEGQQKTWNDLTLKVEK